MPRHYTILFSSFWPMAFFLLLTGCGPELSHEDLGHVEHRLPAIPGAEKPYELPDLTQIEGQENLPEGQENLQEQENLPDGQNPPDAGAERSPLTAC